MKKYQCVRSCYLDGFGCVAAGAIIELADSGVDVRVKKNFVCLTKEEENAAKEKDALEHDMTFKAKVERLKDAKIPLPKGVNKDTVDRLFAEYINKVNVGI